MIIAAPLLVPFAVAVGLPIAGLGAIEIGKKVQDFIEDNPEISMDILTSIKDSLLMTLPGSGSGIGDIFMNKEDSGDDDEVEVKKDTRSKKEIVLEGLRKAREGKGNYSSPDATGSAVSARGNIIRGLEDAGKIKKGPDPNYDPDKKYKGYKKFYKKADGGRVPYQSGGILEGVKNIIGEGLDLGAGAGKFILGAASGIPGAGLLLSSLNNMRQPTISNLAQQNFLDASGAEVDDIGRLTSGIMQGYNTRFDLSPRARARISAIEKLGLTPERRTKIDSLNEFIAQQEAAQAAAAAAAADSQRAREAFLSISQGEGGYTGSTGPTSAGAGMGVGGGYASDYGFKDGGVITLFVETK